MGILDEAIREHLELKRQHGADDSEIKELEDQAFGPGERPGSEGAAAGDGEQLPDLEAEAPTEFMAQPTGRREPAPGAAELQEAPPLEESAVEEPVEEVEAAEEEQPATEHEAIPDLPGDPQGPTTDERHAIADQPTEMYDVEEELGADEPAPPDEDLVAEEASEARLVPPEPPQAPEPVAEDEEEEDDFFDEKRLSDELDQALEAPASGEPESEPEPEPEPEREPEPEAAVEPEQPAPAPDEDVLEETPDFLEEAPEDDQLWFEQKPPKDFDFDD